MKATIKAIEVAPKTAKPPIAIKAKITPSVNQVFRFAEPGFDDYQISKYIDPTLTTMIHPKREMGHTAAQLLLDMLDGKDGSSKILDSKLIIRASTKPI